MRAAIARAGLVAAWAAAACTTAGGGKTGSEPARPVAVGPADHPERAVKMGMRRLSRREYANTMTALLGVSLPKAQIDQLPDPGADYRNDDASGGGLIFAAEALAESASVRLLSDPERLATLAGCRLAGRAADATNLRCLEQFAARFGRRVLRRPITAGDLAHFVGDGLRGAVRAAQDARDVHRGFDAVIRGMLQDPEFLYVVERGDPVQGQAGLYRLRPHEVANRLAFFLWERAPEEALIARADAGRLRSAEDVRRAASELLADERAREQIRTFHARWLGFTSIPYDGKVRDGFRLETRALVNRVLFERKGSWLDLFLSDETYVNDALARHYGLPPPGSAGYAWVRYPEDSGRRGILSHGAVLANGVRDGDTDPILRGQFVLEKLVCDEVDRPEDLSALTAKVEAEAAQQGHPVPPDSACKQEKSAFRRSQQQCKFCHNQMDPAGFGLERFDGLGRVRTVERNEHGKCPPITGEGKLDDVGRFNGPGQLATLLVKEQVIDRCGVRQVFRHAMRRPEDPAGSDDALLDWLTTRFRQHGHRFDQLLLDFVSSEAFRLRRAD